MLDDESGIPDPLWLVIILEEEETELGPHQAKGRKVHIILQSMKGGLRIVLTIGVIWPRK